LISLDHMIDFPNHSRSYDPTRRAARFWGHDSAIEASFFINEDASTRIRPDARPDESGFLNAFDSNRDLICAAAAKVYVRGSRGSYDLVAANFWNNLPAVQPVCMPPSTFIRNFGTVRLSVLSQEPDTNEPVNPDDLLNRGDPMSRKMPTVIDRAWELVAQRSSRS
jgi:hypothetical protein